MTPTIGFLHTSPVHTAAFDLLVAEIAPDAETVVVVDEALLAQARERGPGHAGVLAGIDAALADLERQGAGVIVCTCSTIAGEVERAGRRRGVTVLRADRPMAEAAVRRGPRVAVVAALESTLVPTRLLLEEAARDAGRDIDVSLHLCEGAWARFEAGDHAGYLARIAAACGALAGRCDVVVLAQASMAGAADLVDLGVPVVASPRLAVEAAAAAVGTR